MVLLDGNWENPMDLDDAIQLVRNYYNEDLADEIEKFVPIRCDAEYDALYEEYEKAQYTCEDLRKECEELQTEIGRLELDNEKLEGKIEKLLEENDDLREQIFDMESDY